MVLKKIFIIVLNYNGGKDILACLDSIVAAKTPAGCEKLVLLVDNGQKETQMLKVKSQNYNSKLKIIRNDTNVGFAAGCNVGIGFALKNKADAVLLLNQDTVVEPGFLTPLLENPADIVGPVIKFKRKDRWIYDFGGRVNWWIGRTYHLEYQISNIKYQNDKLKIKSKQAVDYVSGCAILIRRKVFERIGLLDERFFLYFEDTDFCLRAKKAGFKMAVEPASIILHNLIEGKRKPFLQRLHLLKSNLIFINRYIAIVKKPIAYIYWLILTIKVLLS